MAKNKVKAKNIEELVYQIKRGESGPDLKKSAKRNQDERHDGPAKHTYPRKKEMEKLIDYDKLNYPAGKPNKVKLSINEGESRFPTEAKVPNYKKYDSKGNYIKHKVPEKSKEDLKKSGVSAINIMRNMSLSNHNNRNRKKTVT